MYLSFYVLTLSFLAGVFLRSFIAVDAATLLFAFMLALVLGVFAWMCTNAHILYIVLALLACGLGVVRTHMAFENYERALVFSSGTHVSAEGVVAAEPDVRENSVVLWIDTTMVGETPLRLRVKAPLYPEYAYGDSIAFSGELHILEAFETETGRVFDYAGFLMKDRIHYELRHATLQNLESDAGNVVQSALYTIKAQWLTGVSQTIPEPMASLAGGVIVGAKQSLGERWLEMFRETGIIHIVVLSGFNLTIVALAIKWLLARFSPRIATTLAILGIAAFAVMTGGGATVVRASIMAMIGLFVLSKGETRILVRMLALAAVAMVMWNPFVLAFDPGFQLSFVATLGLVLGVPALLPYLSWVPKRFQFRDIVAATLATQSAVLPLLLYSIGEVSLIAPVVNVLVLPLVPFAMLVGFVAGAFGVFSTTLAMPIAWVAYLVFAYMFAVVELFAAVPFASVVLPPVSITIVMGLYALLGWWLFARYKTARVAAVGSLSGMKDA